MSLRFGAASGVVTWRCGCCGVPRVGPARELPSPLGGICRSCGLVVCLRCNLRHRRRGCRDCPHSERGRELGSSPG